MSAGSMQSVGGQLLAQGYAGMGDNLAQGIQQYVQNKRLDATTTGQIEGLMQNGIQQGTSKNWSPTTQKLAQKLSQGSATLNEKMTLLGSLQTDNALQGQNLQRQQQQQELRMNQYRLNAIQGLMGGGQGQAPQGQGAPPMPSSMAPQAGGSQASPGSAQNPPDAVTNFMRNYVRQTGSMPPPEAIGKVLDQQMNIEQPAGVVYAGAKFDANGNAQFDTYHRVYKKASGSVRVDDQNTLAVPYHSAAPGTLLDSSTLAPVVQGTPNAQGVVPPTPGQPPVQPPAHIKTPEQDAAIAEANSDYQTLLQQQSKISQLQQAAIAYTKAPASSRNFNWMTGGPKGLNVRAATGDTTGQQLQAAGGPVFGTVMSGLKNIRNQREFSAVTQQVPLPTDPNDVILQKATAMGAQYGNMLQWNKNYKDNLVAGMPPGAASDKATQETPSPVGTTPTAQTAVSPQKQAGLDWVKDHPNDPRAAQIMAKLQTMQ